MRLIDADGSAEVLMRTVDRRIAESTLDENMKSIFEAIATLLREMPEAEAQWISVKDRLPEGLEEVLTVDHKGNMHIMFHGGGTVPFGILENDLRYYPPTHWMPLPKPPEGCEREEERREGIQPDCGACMFEELSMDESPCCYCEDCSEFTWRDQPDEEDDDV